MRTQTDARDDSSEWIAFVLRVSNQLPPGLQRLARFGFAGIAATATDFAVFNAGVRLFDDPSHGTIIALNTAAFVLATLVSYTLNSRYTFAAAPRREGLLLRYILVAIGGGIVYDASLLALLPTIDSGDPVMLNAAKIVAVALSAVWNFVGFSRFVFADRRQADASVAP